MIKCDIIVDDVIGCNVKC